MSNENKQSLSLNKIDMNYLMNRKKFEKNVKIFTVMSNIAKIVCGVGLGVVGVASYLGTVTPMISVLVGTSYFVGGIYIMLVNALVKQKKEKCDVVLERIKLIAQQQCSERLINGQTFKVVRSNNVESNLKNYSFEQQIIHPTGDKTIDKVVREDLQTGTVSKQYVISDMVDGEECVIGAIEEIKTNDIERKPTEKGSEEKVVSSYTYKWVKQNEIRPYDVDKCNTKSRKK